MASAALSAGEERLDLLIDLVPVVYPKSEIIVKALKVLTALLLSDPACCEKVGLDNQIRGKFEEIRGIRQSKNDIDEVNVDILYDCYFDIMRCYAGAERRVLTFSEFEKMRNYDPQTKLVGVVENGFTQVHNALETLGPIYAPDDWKCQQLTQFRVLWDYEQRKVLQYCYLRAVKPQWHYYIASVLGPKPTLGFLLSVLTPRLLADDDTISQLLVTRNDRDDLHVTSRREGRLAIPFDDLLNFTDVEEERETGLLSSFDRVGAESVSSTYDAMFQEAADCLASMMGTDQDHDDVPVSHGYLDAAVDMVPVSNVIDFPEGAESLRLRHDNGYVESFVHVWSTDVRAQALALALREYDTRVLNLDVIKIGLVQLKNAGKLTQVDTVWRTEVAETISLSKTDADYWLQMVEMLAKDFRKLKETGVPPWLVEVHHIRQREFIESVRYHSVKDPPFRPVPATTKGKASEPKRHSRISEVADEQPADSVKKKKVRLTASELFAKKIVPREYKARFDELMDTPGNQIKGFKPMPFSSFLFSTGADRKRYKRRQIFEILRRECSLNSKSKI